MKTCYGAVIHPQELDDVWASAAVSAGLGLVALHPTGGNTTAESLETYLELLQSGALDRPITFLRAHGVRVESEAHALSWLLPRSLFDAHPEYFRMEEDGKRTPGFNCCPHNEEAIAIIEERASSLAGVIPADDHRYHLWCDDVQVAVCHCEKCKDHSPSDQALLLANAILRGLRKKDPEAKLCFLAYHGTMKVPTNVKPEDGVYLEYAPMDRDYDRPLTDAASAKNAGQIAPLEELLNYFGREDATALDYWYDNSLQSNWKKPPVKCYVETDVVRADKAYYQKMGFPFVTTFACFLGSDYRALHGEIPDLTPLAEEV